MSVETPSEVQAPPTPGGLRGKVIAAYGGAERWRSSETVDARFDCGGLLFNWKRGPDNWKSLHIHADVHRPVVRIEPFDSKNSAAVLEGHDVRIERPGGIPMDARWDARRHFNAPRKLGRWDQMDFAYFLCYAMWNYLTLPALLLNEEIEWREIGANSLEGRFPKHIPTHNKVQQYHFEDSGLLRQYDYDAEVFGPWAKAAHVVPAHASDDGLTYTSKRLILPRMPNGKALPGPKLIWADIHRFRLT
jgi:hypothetical protein